MEPSAPAGLDLPALQRYFRTEIGDLAGPLRATLLAGGKSNLTYRLSDGVRDWVLRRPPLGPLTPTAHDMAREYRVVDALAGTGVPVAETVALCEDTAVIGVPFAVVAFVDGVVLRDPAVAAALPASSARACADALIDGLAALHAVDYRAVGLAEFGRPAGYLERQVKRWRGQWDRVATRRIDTLDRLADALRRTLPATSDDAIVHGDYRLDNTILDHDCRSIRAIVDWEMATLGDPLADLGLLQVYWDAGTEDILGVRYASSANPGFGTADELADRYARRTGRALDELDFYRALGYFKLAVIAEGIHQRYLAGKTVGDGFGAIGSSVPLLLDAGLDTLSRRR